MDLPVSSNQKNTFNSIVLRIEGVFDRLKYSTHITSQGHLLIWWKRRNTLVNILIYDIVNPEVSQLFGVSIRSLQNGNSLHLTKILDADTNGFGTLLKLLISNRCL